MNNLTTVAPVEMQGRDWFIAREAGVIDRPLVERDWMFVDLNQNTEPLPLFATAQKSAFERVVAGYPNVTIAQWIVGHELTEQVAHRPPSLLEETRKVVRTTAPVAVAGLRLLAMAGIALASVMAMALADPALIAVVHERNSGRYIWVCVATWYDL